jgi:hypothetical protein
VSSFKEAIYQNYTDPDGLVCTEKNPKRWSSGNSLLYTGTFVTLLCLRKELEQSDCNNFLQAVSQCEVVMNGIHIPGLFNRNPNRPDFESHDDYVGVATGSFFTNTSFAKAILQHGIDSGFKYDNVNPLNPSFLSWHGRFPGRKAFYYMAAKRDPSFFLKLGFNSGIRAAIDAPKENSSDKILAWLQVKVAQAQNKLPVLCDLWDEHIKNTYGDLSGLFKIYYPKDHPFIEASAGLL